MLSKSLLQRSGCPVSTSLDGLGEKWSLPILRDIVLAGRSTPGQLLRPAEKVATSMLADRLAALEAHGLFTKAVAAG